MSQNRVNNRRNDNADHSRRAHRNGQSGVGNNDRFNRNGGYAGVTRNVRDLCKSPVFKSKINKDAIKKPGYGSNGTPIKLIANLYPINTADITYYHYDIEIKLAQPNGNGTVDIPQPRVKKMRKLAQKENMALITQLANEWMELFTKVAYVFDGLKNLYTNRKLSFADKTQVSRKIAIKFEGVKEETYEVSIQYTKEQIELSAINDFYDGKQETVPQSAIQALEIMMRYMPTQTRIPVGNKLFSRDSQKQIFANINMAFGHYQAVDLTEKGAAVVIDAECTYFYKPEPLITFVLELMPKGISDYDRLKKIAFSNESSMISNISAQISGLKIYTDHTANKRYSTVDKLTVKTPFETVFKIKIQNNDNNNDSEKETNVENYFLDSHNKELQFKNVPCISVKENKFERLPVEVCHVRADQPVPKKRITADMNAEMIGESNQKPLNRFSFIQESAEMVKRESGGVFNDFGVKMGTAPFELMGTVLDAPKCDGSNKRVKFGRQLSDWVFINLSPDVKYEMTLEDQLAFVNDLSYSARGMGIRMASIGRERVENVNYVNQQTIDDVYERCIERYPSLQMIIFCIPDKKIRNDIYRVIKYCGDIKYSVISQCIKDENVLKKPRGYDSKFLYKINGRLGGINTALAQKPKILQTSAIVIGADVSHPSEADDERFQYSIASCVGSYDEDFTKYWSANRVQVKTREEIITDFGDMVQEILVNYKRNNNILPQKILYYRDGVSDGQFEKVAQEYQQLMETCHKLDPNYAPKVTFVIVQKRIHKRFIPYNDMFKDKSIINIPAGTVVDHTITHPLQYEFYLNSHQGLIGTNKPTKYVVLRDDNNMTVDEVQQLTYDLCYAYFKSNQSISIPTPVKYAHLAADRSKQHIVAQNIETVQRVRDETNEQRLARESRNAALLTGNIKVSDAVNASMYYC